MTQSNNAQNGLWIRFCEQLKSRRYTLVRQLSKPRSRERHSSASVWLAEHALASGAGLEQHVLKISSEFAFPDEFSAQTTEQKERLQARERTLYSKLAHPNIPPFAAADTIVIDDSVFNYFATQYIDAPTILDRIQSDEPLSEKESRLVLEHVLAALDHVHTRTPRIFHRDIRPSNILFTGQTGYLFDFNFSAEEGSSGTTVVDNAGYYPVDTYSGNQDPTQDLVALGNVIIAAGLGKEIFTVRDEQNIGFADPVSVEDLPYSGNLKKFLRKLTSANPGLRYQSAKQATDDLKTLDVLSSGELEVRMTTLRRCPEIERMLSFLSQHDALYRHNVPPNVLENYSDDRLLDHLKTVYAKPEFILSDPEEIKKYVAPCDKVVAKKMSDDATLMFKEKEECWITTVGKEGLVEIKSFDSGKCFSVSVEDLVVYGQRNFGKEYFNANLDVYVEQWEARRRRFIRTITPDEAVRFPATSWKDIRRKLIVAPTKDIYKTTWRVPQGAIGVVGEVKRNNSFNDNKTTLHVLWMDTEGLFFESYSGEFGSGHSNRIFLDVADLALHKRNPINYERLYASCFGADSRSHS